MDLFTVLLRAAGWCLWLSFGSVDSFFLLLQILIWLRFCNLGDDGVSACLRLSAFLFGATSCSGFVWVFLSSVPFLFGSDPHLLYHLIIVLVCGRELFLLLLVFVLPS